MDLFGGSTYILTRLVFQRGLSLVYLIAFVSALFQFRPLLGERGMLPVPEFLKHVTFGQSPSLFHFFYSDRFFFFIACSGAVIAACALMGFVEKGPLWFTMLCWALLWCLYLSIVNVGQRWYAFGWETLLLETGFLAIFLGNAATVPPAMIIWLLRWVVFRVEFGAGLIKMRGDACWRDLSCLNYHHETQPMPNPLSWYFHHLPAWFHRVETFGNHVVQLFVPFGLFLPGRIAAVSGGLLILTQLWLMVSGNFAFLNLITIVLALTAFDDAHLRPFFAFFSSRLPEGTFLASSPPLFFLATVVVSALVIVLSFRPVKNMLSPSQMMNASFEPFHLVNTYGAFGSVTKKRYEVVIEGTRDPTIRDETVWQEYGFKGKPGDIRRRPAQVAPYHLRLDWLMWFLPFNGYPPRGYETWFARFVQKLLEGDGATLLLLRTNPFTNVPPTYIRARYYLYRFTTNEEREATGDWWVRELVGEYLPPMSLSNFTQTP